MSEQQPEAWIIVNKETGYRTQVSDLTPFLYHREIFEVIPLYTAPPVKPEQEPVAWMWEEEGDEGCVETIININKPRVNVYRENIRPLYLAPPKPKPLTPQQISEGNQSMLNVTREAFKQGVIFAEKAHGIGGGE